jgi:hypothetical protein
VKEFIAVTDDYLYETPNIFAHLVPFSINRPCRRLATEPLAITPADLQIGDFSQPDFAAPSRDSFNTRINEEGDTP